MRRPSSAAAEDETASFLLSYYEQQLGQYQAQLELLPQQTADELAEDLLVEEKALMASVEKGKA